MPLKSNLKDVNLGLAIFPANKTFFDRFFLIKFMIFPNFPILILNELLSLLNLLFFEKSIIKYFIFNFFIFF